MWWFHRETKNRDLVNVCACVSVWLWVCLLTRRSWKISLNFPGFRYLQFIWWKNFCIYSRFWFELKSFALSCHIFPHFDVQFRQSVILHLRVYHRCFLFIMTWLKSFTLFSEELFWFYSKLIFIHNQLNLKYSIYWGSVILSGFWCKR